MWNSHLDILIKETLSVYSGQAQTPPCAVAGSDERLSTAQTFLLCPQSLSHMDVLTQGQNHSGWRGDCNHLFL